MLSSALASRRSSSREASTSGAASSGRARARSKAAKRQQHRLAHQDAVADDWRRRLASSVCTSAPEVRKRPALDQPALEPHDYEVRRAGYGWSMGSQEAPDPRVRASRRAELR